MNTNTTIQTPERDRMAEAREQTESGEFIEGIHRAGTAEERGGA